MGQARGEAGRDGAGSGSEVSKGNRPAQRASYAERKPMARCPVCTFAPRRGTAAAVLAAVARHVSVRHGIQNVLTDDERTV